VDTLQQTGITMDFKPSNKSNHGFAPKEPKQISPGRAKSKLSLRISDHARTGSLL
jgi:hypothetical protein